MLTDLNVLLSASLLVPLPDGFLFGDAPATIEQMRAIEEIWAMPSDAPAVTLSTVRPGWMSIKIGKGFPDWPGSNDSIPVAVTTYNGQLFINMAIRFDYPMWGFRKRDGGKECYGTVAVVEIGDGINLTDLDGDKMRVANSWYPKDLPDWEGGQFNCGNLVVRAEAARHQRVGVILDPKSWFDGPLHRIPADGLDKKRAAQ